LEIFIIKNERKFCSVPLFGTPTLKTGVAGILILFFGSPSFFFFFFCFGLKKKPKPKKKFKNYPRPVSGRPHFFFLHAYSPRAHTNGFPPSQHLLSPSGFFNMTAMGPQLTPRVPPPPFLTKKKTMGNLSNGWERKFLVYKRPTPIPHPSLQGAPHWIAPANKKTPLKEFFWGMKRTWKNPSCFLKPIFEIGIGPPPKSFPPFFKNFFVGLNVIEI